MKLIKNITRVFLIITLNFSFAQTHDSYYQSIVDNCSLSSIQTNLDEFVNHGVKSIGSTELVNAKDWLKAKYASYGYTDIVEDDFSVGGGNTATNIVVTKQGLVYPDTYVIIDGHYDTINGVGANDNGSGTVLILEIARLLANVPTEYSIKFINFSAEEVGLIGSQHYVDNVVNATTPKMDIRLVFNIDEVGGISGMTNDTIVCEEDTSNPPGNNSQSSVMTNELATCIGLYSSLNTEISYAYASDYIPFENNGEIITGLYEKNETPHAHTATDIIANMDVNYVYEITKGSTGALLHFAVANQSLTVSEEVDNTIDLRFFPNPTQGILYIKSNDLINKDLIINLYSIVGKLVLSKEFVLKDDAAKDSISLKGIQSGVYILEAITNGNKTTQKIIVK